MDLDSVFHVCVILVVNQYGIDVGDKQMFMLESWMSSTVVYRATTLNGVSQCLKRYPDNILNRDTPNFLPIVYREE